MAPGTVALQDPLPMKFSRQEYWSTVQFPIPGYHPDPYIYMDHPDPYIYIKRERHKYRSIDIKIFEVAPDVFNSYKRQS